MRRQRSDLRGVSVRSERRRPMYEEGVELSGEDEEILDRVWDQIANEDQHRLNRYTPVMTDLVSWLKILDAEATPLPSGYPVGLWWYARHKRRDEVNPKNCRNEEDWSRRLKELMSDRGIVASCEESYPTPPKRRCDLVIQWPNLGRVWLEVKGAWRHSDADGKVRNSPFRKHLGAAGDDLRKVCSLDSATADHIGVLLVGFDTDDDPIADEHVELVRSKSTRGDWIEQQLSWPDPKRRGGRIRVWLWLTDAHIPKDIFDLGKPPTSAVR